MSDASPFTFHAVGAPGEPVHYELRDLAGRVVCKAFRSGIGVCVWAGGADLIRCARLSGYTDDDVEALMRATAKG